MKTANSGWLAWVSNADPEYMEAVKNTYNLSGNLDTSSYYAGKGTENIIGIEIKVYTDVNTSEPPPSTMFNGVEITPTLSYMIGNSWTSFNQKVTVNGGFDGLRIQTSANKDYYLSYKTLNQGNSYYYPAVSSIGSDYAGLSGKKIQQLNIKALNNSGNTLRSGIVVMYRAYVDGAWLPWVSNADPEYMYSVQSKFNLGGTLDTSGAYAGKSGKNIEGIEIRIFEGSIPSSTVDNLSGSEVYPTMSYMVNSSSNWISFSSKVEAAMDGIKIQTDPSKGYYLNYRTMNAPNTSYYSYVTSIENDYAGLPGKKITRLSIEVRRTSDNSEMESGVVVMYRAKVDGNWLPWVSNADPEWMYSVQIKYGIKGVLDINSGYAGKSDGSPIQGVEIRVFEENELTSLTTNTGRSKVINVPYINQTEKYKTACESVSAVMVLQYYNQNISPKTFIDNYLDKGSSNSFDPNVCFGGDPYSETGMGCYAPVITKAVNEYLDRTGVNLAANTVIGKDLDELCDEYIDNNIPVILWATTDMKAPYPGRQIPYGNSYIQWIAPEHCLVLVGYNDNSYIFNDSQRKAKIYYDKDDVVRAYLGLGSQAVIIAPTDGSNPSNFTATAPSSKPNVSAEEKKPDNVVDESYDADPIDLYTGSHVITNDILNLFGGQNIAVTAKYDSSKLVEGELGVGWYHNYEKYLLFSDIEVLAYENPSTYCTYVDLDQNGIFDCATLGRNGYKLTITSDPNYNYIIDCNGEKKSIMTETEN